MLALPRLSASDEVRERTALAYLACFGLLAVAPHATEQPWWVSAIFALGAAARLLAPAFRPGRLVRALLAVLVLLLVYRHYRGLFGRDPGFALLIALLGLKFFEFKSVRDYSVSAFLLLLVVGGGFLYEQTLTSGAYALVAVVAGLVVLIRLAQPQGLALRGALRLATVLTLQAVPLMLVFYFLFPRMHGTLWGFGEAGGRATTGLSSTMQPGSITSLSESSEPAFRATFAGPVPVAGQRYWRALVLWHTDGRRWQRGGPAGGQTEELFPASPPLSYRLLLEPSRNTFLPALDLPVGVPAGARAAPGFMRERREPVSERIEYELVSYFRYRTGRLSGGERLAALQLPAIMSERVQTLAGRLRASPSGAVQAVLDLFRQENFVYTLRPPRLGDDPVDEFLFETRRGFCEHYAAAFVTLMRAAGIPSRVVTGYLGGDYGAAGNYVIVRQWDAHAWAEVWLEGEGWVRVDPTAAVAPERIEYGIDALRRLEAQGLIPGTIAGEALERAVRLGLLEHAWLRAQLYWDFANIAWYRWVTEYTPERQARLLAALGLERLDALRLTALLVAAAALVVGSYLGWWWRRRRPRDPLVAAYARFCRKLARAGLVRAPHEGPVAFAARAGIKRPDLKQELETVTALYIALRYARRPESAAGLTRLRHAISTLRI